MLFKTRLVQLVMPQPWALSSERFGTPSPTDRARPLPPPNPPRIRRRTTTVSSRLCISRPRRPVTSTGFRSTFSCRFSKFSAPESRRGWERSANRGNFWSRITGCGFIFCSIGRSPGTLFSSPRPTCDRAILFSKMLIFQKAITVSEFSIDLRMWFWQLLVDSFPIENVDWLVDFDN